MKPWQRAAVRILERAVRSELRARTAPRRARRGAATTARRDADRVISYAPDRDSSADPGEVVWTVVAYEDDPSSSKDRPVLVVGRKDARTVLALMLSSQAKRDGQDGWLSLGTGSWDARGRPSWVRLDRVLELDDDSIRREGAVLDRPAFERVSRLLRERYGWE